jgi:hypothetical protein
MATFTKLVLSGSTNGQPIQITSTSGTGQTIHVATSTSGELDEVFIVAWNNAAAARTLTLQIGGTGTANIMKFTLNAGEGAVIVYPGLPLKGGVTVYAIADVANDVLVSGHVINKA